MSKVDTSPRPSKRRKIATYGPTRSTATIPSPNSPSVLRSLSNAVSGISRRLFEPKTTRAAAAHAVDSANESEELNPHVQQALEKAIQSEEGEQEDREDHDGNGGTERSATTENGAPGAEDVITPVGKRREVNHSSKGSTRNDVSVRKSSARRLRATNETAAKAPRTRRPSSSSSTRETTHPADATGGTPESRTTDVAHKASASDGSAALPSQRRFRSRDTTSGMVVQEHGPENDTGDGDTVAFHPRSSGREKRKPRRYSADVEDMAEQHRHHPVGILTPSKRDRTRARKSVVFDDDVQLREERLHFKDVEPGSLATDHARWKSTASHSDPQRGRRSEPTEVSPERVPLADDEESDEDELVVDGIAWPNTVPVLESPVHTRPVLSSLPDVHVDPHLTAIKAVVLSRLMNSSLVPLTHLTTEYAKVHALLKATVTAGEGNSILVLGARGSGKTNLIETALAEVRHAHPEDFHVVRLNGFQQTDDKIALRDIWRQLGREMQVDEDETNQVSSYADTMASLLHLLSHPHELAEVLDPAAPATTTKSVIFLLDEFDLFATHPRQTLLYNLFDIAQAKKAPIAVIGCSTRVDVAESLEKRVKSRFSHRWVHLSQPQSVHGFAEVVEAALCLPVAEGDAVDASGGSWRAAWNAYITSIFIPSPPVQALLRQTFYTTKSIPAAFSALYIPVARITSLAASCPIPRSIAPLSPPDSPLALLPSLPTLHLSLLVAAARLDAIHHASLVNFNLVYHHYVELASRSRLQSSASGARAQGGVTKIWGPEIARGAWEDLGAWEILVPAVLGKGTGDDAPATTMWRVDVRLEEVRACLGDLGPGASEVLAKWCTEI